MKSANLSTCPDVLEDNSVVASFGTLGLPTKPNPSPPTHLSRPLPGYIHDGESGITIEKVEFGAEFWVAWSLLPPIPLVAMQCSHLRMGSGVSMVVSTSSMFSSRTKWERHREMRLAFMAQPIGPRSYKPATPVCVHAYVCVYICVLQCVLRKRASKHLIQSLF